MKMAGIRNNYVEVVVAVAVVVVVVVVCCGESESAVARLRGPGCRRSSALSRVSHRLFLF